MQNKALALYGRALAAIQKIAILTSRMNFEFNPDVLASLCRSRQRTEMPQTRRGKFDSIRPANQIQRLYCGVIVILPSRT